MEGNESEFIIVNQFNKSTHSSLWQQKANGFLHEGPDDLQSYHNSALDFRIFISTWYEKLQFVRWKQRYNILLIQRKVIPNHSNFSLSILDLSISILDLSIFYYTLLSDLESFSGSFAQLLFNGVFEQRRGHETSSEYSRAIWYPYEKVSERYAGVSCAARVYRARSKSRGR